MTELMEESERRDGDGLGQRLTVAYVMKGLRNGSAKLLAVSPSECGPPLARWETTAVFNFE